MDNTETKIKNRNANKGTTDNKGKGKGQAKPEAKTAPAPVPVSISASKAYESTKDKQFPDLVVLDNKEYVPFKPEKLEDLANFKEMLFGVDATDSKEIEFFLPIFVDAEKITGIDLCAEYAGIPTCFSTPYLLEKGYWKNLNGNGKRLPIQFYRIKG